MVNTSTVNISLVILGAQKSGTTSLHQLLDRHPDIYMSKPLKEPGYYLPLNQIQRSWKRKKGFAIQNREQLLKRYMLASYNKEPIIGESSTYYTIGFNARKLDIPKRIMQNNPSMKFIYIMRNPIERIFSNYKHLVYHHGYNESFSKFLETSEGRRALLTTCYYYQISAYIEFFGQQNIFVESLENLINKPAKVTQSIFQFLELKLNLETLKLEKKNSSPYSSDTDIKKQINYENFEKIMNYIKSDLYLLKKYVYSDIENWNLSWEAFCKDHSLK